MAIVLYDTMLYIWCSRCKESKTIHLQGGTTMADVLMYYNDVMLCYGISANELKQSYIKKFEKNMKRW